MGQIADLITQTFSLHLTDTNVTPIDPFARPKLLLIDYIILYLVAGRGGNDL